MNLTAITALLPVLIKLFLMLLERTKDLPDEERKKVLKELDDSLSKIKTSNSTSDLEKWVGTRL